MNNHSLKVNEIAATLKSASALKQRLRIYHGRSHTTREIPKDQILDISELDEILEINTKEKYALVEPNVTMKQLVQETLKNGLLPLIVTEFPEITIGGAIQGGAGESSSFKYGLVHSTCDEYEIVLGNGEVVITSNKINPELFLAIPCSYGSLGVLTYVKVRLVEAKKYVELSYIRVHSFSELVDTIYSNRNLDIDFLDAIMFSRDNGIVMVGRMVDEPLKQQETIFSRSTDDWFYLYVFKKLEGKVLDPDYIPITEYLFRYNQGAFWIGKFLFDYLYIPVNNFTKKLLHRYLDAKTLYKGLHLSNRSQSGLVQDFCLPSNEAVNFLNYLHNNLDKYPIWICPIKGSGQNDLLSPHHLNSEIVINVGYYAYINKKFEDFVKLNKSLEAKLENSHGRKVLYAHQYYTPEEFWKIYDQVWYKKLRTACHADNIFPDIYEKTNVNKKYKTQSFITFVKFLISAVRS